MFGSYGRGTAAVGSDLDLLLIDARASGPQPERLQRWPLELLPLSCDALVLTPAGFGHARSPIPPIQLTVVRAAPASADRQNPCRNAEASDPLFTDVPISFGWLSSRTSHTFRSDRSAVNLKARAARTARRC